MAVEITTRPEHRVEQWQNAVMSCLNGLERDDKRQVEELKTIEALNEALGRLHLKSESTASLQGLSTTTLSLPHFHTFCRCFEASVDGKVDTSCVWGMMYLVVEASIPLPSRVY
jgi:hypothetical protein